VKISVENNPILSFYHTSIVSELLLEQLLTFNISLRSCRLQDAPMMVSGSFDSNEVSTVPFPALSSCDDATV
jgi:hypothetical protein